MDVNDLDTFVRNQLSQQSGLFLSQIRNELSLYGPLLEKQVYQDNTNIFDTITPDSPVILFNVSPRSSTNINVSETDENDNLTIYCAFNAHIIIYGDAAMLLAQKLIARLRSQVVREIFLANDVYIENVSEALQIEEYKNSVMWIRDDFELDIACKIKVADVIPNTPFSDYSEISTITESNSEQVIIYKSNSSSDEDEDEQNSGESNESDDLEDELNSN